MREIFKHYRFRVLFKGALVLFLTSSFFASCKKDEIIIQESHFTICSQLKELQKNQPFVEKLSILYEESKVNNYETGYLLYPSNFEIYTFQKIQGIPNSATLSINVKDITQGFIHCHYTNLYPTFSGSDIKAIYDLYDLGLIQNADRFICGVVTPFGPAYLLKVANLEQFLSFSESNFEGAMNFRNFESNYNNNRKNL